MAWLSLTQGLPFLLPTLLWAAALTKSCCCGPWTQGVLRMGGEGVSLPPNLHPQLPWVGNAPISRGKHASLGGAHLGPCWWL